MTGLCLRTNCLFRAVSICDRGLVFGGQKRIHGSAVNLLRNTPYLPPRSEKSRFSPRRDSFLSAHSRSLHATSAARHGGIDRPAPGTGIKVHFKDSKGTLIKTVEGNEGDDLLDVAHEYDIDLEGACEKSLACSTCHVILTPDVYDKLPEPEDDENDMLDMAFGLTETSRLGCQVKLTKELDGMTAVLPSATRNMFVDGKKPTKH
ncbi:hypothetical protein AGABI2DRAFT_209951 [Agaricus bisporus var. bisporus H97]|uniref:hypothetical protein n=1 Tax=Agaricus bisporus var. bisporus (strain H97 / ATCC MYA-4626 / FGSC 10389) TaxID=936046 RepID=UPI00029F79A3|nr:hypothetical protein AGABI2DRAFT_209951 [Agaricus bisporus var. bisporus H97]EKV44220.1 hypothetical protein AGABI2DRAFT_209951 [Agaricus bisporus var. bisporus H97]